jgi:hypothetical protein
MGEDKGEQLEFIQASVKAYRIFLSPLTYVL